MATCTFKACPPNRPERSSNMVAAYACSNKCCSDRAMQWAHCRVYICCQAPRPICRRLPFGPPTLPTLKVARPKGYGNVSNSITRCKIQSFDHAVMGCALVMGKLFDAFHEGFGDTGGSGAASWSTADARCAAPSMHSFP